MRTKKVNLFMVAYLGLDSRIAPNRKPQRVYHLLRPMGSSYTTMRPAGLLTCVKQSSYSTGTVTTISPPFSKADE